MLLSKDCLKKYGDPHLGMNMIIWALPCKVWDLKLPKKIYCNKDMVRPLEKAFTNLIDRGFMKEFHSFDGCFNIRPMRNGSGSMSLHSWGVAIDVNAKTNAMGHKPTLTPEFVKCFTDVGFDWGGVWKNPDGMHFQLKSI